MRCRSDKIVIDGEMYDRIWISVPDGCPACLREAGDYHSEGCPEERSPKDGSEGVWYQPCGEIFIPAEE